MPPQTRAGGTLCACIIGIHWPTTNVLQHISERRSMKMARNISWSRESLRLMSSHGDHARQDGNMMATCSSGSNSSSSSSSSTCRGSRSAPGRVRRVRARTAAMSGGCCKTTAVFLCVLLSSSLQGPVNAVGVDGRAAAFVQTALRNTPFNRIMANRCPYNSSSRSASRCRETSTTGSGRSNSRSGCDRFSLYRGSSTAAWLSAQDAARGAGNEGWDSNVVATSSTAVDPSNARASSTTTALAPPEPCRPQPTTTRLDFLRQSSVAAVAVSAAASSGLLLPDQPASAISQTDVTTTTTVASTATAASTTSPRASTGGGGGGMVWLDEDSGTVSSRLSQADETYGQGFVVYLARFLLNYDEGCRDYFNGKLDLVVPRRDGSEMWDEFRGFVASVGLGLHRFQGAKGACDLCDSLSRKYASTDREGSAEQLAMLFSFLPPGVQPVSAVKSLLALPTGRGGSSALLRGVSASDAAAGFDLLSVLRESPSALLPVNLRPRYDEAEKVFYVPGVPRQSNEDEVALAFGARGPFPISKERRLTALDFGRFAACGAVGCTSTHLTVIPLDVVKTRLQTDPGRYDGLAEGVTTIAREEGWPMLLQGLGPTLAGYFWYGITVYPGYELFKRLYIGLVGPLNAALFRVPLVLLAGASATFFACIGVCPAEAVRIRQVADPSVGGLSSAVKQIVSESGWGKLYEGLPSILFRQISFGMMKFLVFDLFTEFVYGILPMLAEQTSTQLSVSLMSGLVAGVCAAIVSQPADTVLSTMNRDSGRASIPGTVKAIVDERGVGGLFLGLQSRIVWSGAIISGQFLLYDLCKTALHVSADDLRVFLDAIDSAGL